MGYELVANSGRLAITQQRCCDWQFHHHTRGRVQGARGQVGGHPQSPPHASRGGPLFSSPARHGSPKPRWAPVAQGKGRVKVSPVTDTQPALSYQPETVEQGRGEAAPLIDWVQARRFRKVFEERGQPGKNLQQNEFGTGPICAQGA